MAVVKKTSHQWRIHGMVEHCEWGIKGVCAWHSFGALWEVEIVAAVYRVFEGTYGTRLTVVMMTIIKGSQL